MTVNPGLTISDIFASLTTVFNALIPFLLLLGTVVFLSGIVKYLTAGGDEGRIKEAKQLMMYGIIALAAMVAVWAFVNVVVSAIFGTTVLPPIPGVNIAPFN